MQNLKFKSWTDPKVHAIFLKQHIFSKHKWVVCKKNWHKCIPTFLQNLKVFNSQIFCQLLKYLSSFLLSKHTQLKICIYPLSVFLLPLFWSHSYWPTSTGRNWHWCFFFKKERQQETLKKYSFVQKRQHWLSKVSSTNP